MICLKMLLKKGKECYFVFSRNVDKEFRTSLETA